MMFFLGQALKYRQAWDDRAMVRQIGFGEHGW